MKLHRKKPPKHTARVTKPVKGLPSPARLRLNVQQTRARSGKKQ